MTGAKQDRQGRKDCSFTRHCSAVIGLMYNCKRQLCGGASCCLIAADNLVLSLVLSQEQAGLQAPGNRSLHLFLPYLPAVLFLCEIANAVRFSGEVHCLLAVLRLIMPFSVALAPHIILLLMAEDRIIY